MKYRISSYIIVSALAAALFVPGAGNDAAAQLGLPVGVDNLPRLPDLDIERRTRRTVEDTADTADEAVEETEETVEETTGDTLETAEQLVEETTEAVEDVVDAATGALRAFAGDTDPNGWDVERDTIVVLIDSARVDSLLQTATQVISLRELPALGQTMLVLRRTTSLAMPDAIGELRELNPGASVDYNHLYRYNADVGEDAVTTASPPAQESLAIDADAPRIGIIDSAVMPEHHALQGVTVVGKDLATHEGLRPLTHGTAVASIVAASSEKEAVIYSASVFFQMPNHAPGATAESMVAALDWLVAEDVDVINMSLTGPGNAILEAAVAALVEKQVTIVAAVGNNGPSSEPLYPAAYDGVIGITAVDHNKRIFRYANRGDYVDYAARGVNVKVADSTTGGYRIESGTSMASPHVAVVAAQLLRESRVEPDALMSWLMAGAEDLGRKGFDTVFGHGLITRPPVVVSAN